jgi:hypothetical protein
VTSGIGPSARIFALGTMLIVTGAASGQQQPGALDGTWYGHLKKGGRDMQLKAEFAGDSGTFVYLPNRRKGKASNCIGLAMPMAVAAITETEFRIDVKASKALVGCEDWSSRLTRTSAHRLEADAFFLERE